MNKKPNKQFKNGQRKRYPLTERYVYEIKEY